MANFMRLLQAFKYFGLLLIIILSVKALSEYQGQAYIYILFTIISNFLLYYGFRDKAIFFDTFMGLFLWLGFWLKVSVRVSFMDGEFHESTGAFDGSGKLFDQALLVSMCGMLGVLFASIIRERFIFVYPRKLEGVSLKGLYNFYLEHRTSILLSFAFLIIAVAASNMYFGFYQRGSVPKTVLPLGLNGVYTWLLLFGLASITAVLLHFEIERTKKTSYLLAFLGLMEAFFSSMSLLSRAMVLNVSALAIGAFKNLKVSMIPLSFKFISINTMLFLMLFGASVLGVNYLRATAEGGVLKQTNAGVLFLDRWVGIEGVMAVSSYDKLGWNLWKDAWEERFTHETTTFYDLNIIDTPYKNVDSTKHHYVSLPGALAFCFYPGSFLFLFMCMIIFGLFAALIEFSVYHIGGKNIILCALFAQIVAYRFSSFGYVPIQSYMLFGTIFLNIVLIYLVNKGLLFWQKR